jgi:hypothetical protein
LPRQRPINSVYRPLLLTPSIDAYLPAPQFPPRTTEFRAPDYPFANLQKKKNKVDEMARGNQRDKAREKNLKEQAGKVR